MFVSQTTFHTGQALRFDNLYLSNFFNSNAHTVCCLLYSTTHPVVTECDNLVLGIALASSITALHTLTYLAQKKNLLATQDPRHASK